MGDKQPDRLERAGARMRKVDGAPPRKGEMKKKCARQQLPAEEKGPERKPLHGILNSLDDVVWTFYPGETRPHFVNSAVEKVYGRPAEDFYRQDLLWLEMVHPADRETVQRSNEVIEGTGLADFYDLEYRIVRPDGGMRWIRNRSRLICNDRGEAVRMTVDTDITGRKRTEEALRKSEERYRSIVAAIPDLVIRCSREGDYLDIIAKDAGKFIGGEKGLIGKNVREVWPFATAELFLSHISRALQTGEVQQFEYTLEVWNVPLNFEARLVASGENEVIAIIRDITREKKAAEDLRKSEKRYRTLVDNISAGVYRNRPGPRGEFIMANPAFLRMFGFKSREELFQVTMSDLYQDSAEREKFSNLLLKKGRLTGLELRLKRKDGTPIWGLVTATVVHDQQGRPQYFDCSIEDITERKRAEEALRESEQKYRQILDSIEEGYYEVDLAGHIIFFNEATCRLFNLTHGELQGMHYARLFKEPRYVYDHFHRVYLTGEPVKGIILEARRKDGRKAFGEISITPIKDQEGRIVGFRGLGRDTTERKQFEEKLRYLSMHDQLTGLYNRNFFKEELDRLEGGRDYPVTILSADLDGLKLINDTLGHKKGDELLLECVSLLRESLRKSDVLARVGGDEFAALLPRTDEKTGDAVIRRLQVAIQRYNSEHSQLPISISIGAATSSGPQEPLEEIYKKADNMMYRDKLYRSAGARSQIVNALLATLAERDYITEGHAARLQELCQRLGEEVGLTSNQLIDLALLAQVHDLGKVGIPDYILFKKEALTPEEWEIMKQHSEKGYRIARSSPDLMGVADLILKHHEHWDGSGYPLGLKGEEIPLVCRILSIVDAYDAMVNDRPYSAAMSEDEAMAELARHAGTQFDPHLVPVFLKILAEMRRSSPQKKV